MTIEKRIGKIQSVTVGLVGYQDAMLGIQVSLGSDKQGWSVGDSKGFWGPEIKCSEHAKWTEADRSKAHDETLRFIGDLLVKAKVRDVVDLKGIPVEVEFEGNGLKSWRILEEAI